MSEEIEYIEENDDLISLSEDNELEVVEKKEKSIMKKSFHDDFDYVRTNIKTIIDIGMTAMTNISNIARESEHPRIYECLSELITNNTINNAKLLDIYSNYKHVIEEELDADFQGRPINNNTLIIGTSTDIQKMIEDKIKTMKK